MNGLLLLLLVPTLQAQELSFCAAEEHYDQFYITAYYDHDGVDWNCGDYQYSGHRGSDYGVGSWTGMDAGRNLVAAADGTVVATNDGEDDRCSTGDCGGGGGYGNYVKLQHADGTYTYYAHMKQWSVAVSTGSSVGCGTYLGQVGSSGNSTGPHVHFEVRNSGSSQFDPFAGSCSSSSSAWASQGSYMGKPALSCGSPEPCEPAGTLHCGDSFDSSNNAAGSTDSHSWYGCSEFIWTGSEIVWEFSTSMSEPVSVSMTGLSEDLDLLVLSSAACDGGGCIAYSDNSKTSDESLEFDASAGTTYVILVDGWEDAVSNFRLSVSCEGSTEDTEEPDDTAPPDTDDPPDTGEDKEDEEDEEPPPHRDDRIRKPGSLFPMAEGEPGCGCGSGGAISGLWWLSGLLALARRRATRGLRAPRIPR